MVDWFNLIILCPDDVFFVYEFSKKLYHLFIRNQPENAICKILRYHIKSVSLHWLLAKYAVHSQKKVKMWARNWTASYDFWYGGNLVAPWLRESIKIWYIGGGFLFALLKNCRNFDNLSYFFILVHWLLHYVEI